MSSPQHSITADNRPRTASGAGTGQPPDQPRPGAQPYNAGGPTALALSTDPVLVRHIAAYHRSVRTAVLHPIPGQTGTSRLGPGDALCVLRDSATTTTLYVSARGDPSIWTVAASLGCAEVLLWQDPADRRVLRARLHDHFRAVAGSRGVGAPPEGGWPAVVAP